MLQTLLEETRHAIRRLFRAPAFALASILVLAIGIGANTAMFSVVSALVLRPQPYATPERLVDIYQDSDDGEPNSSSFPAYRDMRAHEQVFEDVVAFANFTATLQQEDGARTVATEIVTSNYFGVLGIPLQAGAGLGPEHDSQGSEPLVILSDAAWRTLFGSDPDILGETVRLNGTGVTVAGIADPGYSGSRPGLHTDLFVSISSMGPIWGEYVGTTLDRRADHWFMVKGRLADGVSAQQAQAAMTTLADRLAREFPEFNEGRRITVFAPGEIRLHPSADAEVIPASVALMVITGLLLLLVCANVANLFLVRATSRSDEVALRRALGAPRSRIIVHALSESVLLSLTGGALGVFAASFAMRALESGALPLPLPNAIDLRLDGQVLGFSLLLAVGAGVLFGGFPGIRLSRGHASAALRSGESTAAGGPMVRWARNVLVGAQVAVSFVILTLAALFAQGLANATSVDLGFSADNVAILQTDASHAGYDAGEAGRIYTEIRDRVGSLPGVEAAALAGQLPVMPGGSSTLVIEGYQSPSGTNATEVERSVVGDAYFETLGIPVLYGRDFEPADAVSDTAMVLVSRSMAETYWGRTDVVGESIGFQSSPGSAAPIIGVVDDVKIREIGEQPTPVFYVYLGRTGARNVYLLARTAGSPETTLPALRTELHARDAQLPVLGLLTLEEHISSSLALPRASATALAGFGLLGLLLAGVGLYAVVAFAVQRRSRELGIRIALGAGSGSVVRMVLREMLLVTGLALAAGWSIALLATPSLASGLIGVDGLNATATIVTVVLLIAASVLAAWMPARRAARVDPVEALRQE